MDEALNNQSPEIWIGIAMRGFGGDPPPKSTSLASLLFGLYDGCFRDDLFSWDVPYVKLTECFSMPPENSPLKKDPDADGTLATLLPMALISAIAKLRRIPLKFFEQWRSEGRELDLFIIVQTPAEAVRVPLSTEFLLICNELKLPIEVYTDHGGNVGKPRKRKKRPRR